MAESVTQSDVQRAYDELDRIAREHKRLANRHRRAALALRIELDRLRPLLGRVGIRLVEYGLPVIRLTEQEITAESQRRQS